MPRKPQIQPADPEAEAITNLIAEFGDCLLTTIHAGIRIALGATNGIGAVDINHSEQQVSEAWLRFGRNLTEFAREG